MTMLRRIGSVLLGFIVILLLVGVTDAILEKLFPAQFVNADGSYAIPRLPLVAFIIGYAFVYAGVGGYLTARIAPQSLCHMRWRSARCSCSSVLLSLLPTHINSLCGIC